MYSVCKKREGGKKGEHSTVLYILVLVDTSNKERQHNCTN